MATFAVGKYPIPVQQKQYHLHIDADSSLQLQFVHQYLHIFTLHCFTFSIQCFFCSRRLSASLCHSTALWCKTGSAKKLQTKEIILLLPSLLLVSVTADTEAREADLHGIGISILSLNQDCSKHFLFCLTVLQILEILILWLLDATKDRCVSQV